MHKHWKNEWLVLYKYISSLWNNVLVISLKTANDKACDVRENYMIIMQMIMIKHATVTHVMRDLVISIHLSPFIIHQSANGLHALPRPQQPAPSPLVGFISCSFPIQSSITMGGVPNKTMVCTILMQFLF